LKINRTRHHKIGMTFILLLLRNHLSNIYPTEKFADRFLSLLNAYPIVIVASKSVHTWCKFESSQ